jgi:hypothetical protein
MTVDKNLGRKCKYYRICSLYKGEGLPDDIQKTVWRNVFCNRGMKGWSNCKQFTDFELKQITEYGAGEHRNHLPG